jgi:hypothetical protein
MFDIEKYIKAKTKDKGHEPLVRRAAEEYLKHPVLCLNCRNMIPLRENEQPADAKKKKFCSHTCAAQYNNRKRGFKSGKQRCPRCGKKKYYTAKMCQTCITDQYWESIKNKPIKEFFGKGASRAKFNNIREWARKLMKRSGIKRKCFLCEYSETVQVAHMKKISEFSEDTPIGIVNDLSNLIYLCPNEHILYDKGKLKIK